MSSSTRITALAYEDLSLYVGGITSDDNMRNYTSIFGGTPLIIRYGQSGSNFNYLWGRTIKTSGNYIVNGIATCKNGSYVIFHAFSPYQDSIIAYLRNGGFTNYVFTYPNSKNNASLNKRNIMVGLMNDWRTYRFIFGSRYTDTTTGY